MSQSVAKVQSVKSSNAIEGIITSDKRIEATVLDSLVPISKIEICATHPDISPTTVEAVLGKMVKKGLIKKIGASRDSRYIRND